MANIQTQSFVNLVKSNGDTVRHWKCFRDVPFDTVGPNGETVEGNGFLYVEQPLAPDVKALIGSTYRETADSDVARIETGQTNIICLPDEIELSNDDRVLLIERRVIYRQTIKPNSENRARLERDFVTNLQVVSGGAATLETQIDGASFVSWQGATPELVEFSFQPLYAFRGDSDRGQTRGADGERLPQRGVLMLENRN